MDITPRLAESVQRIERYGTSGFGVSGVDYPQSILVLKEKTLPWEVADFSLLANASFDPLLVEPELPEILLIGCGAAQQFLPPSIRNYLREKGIIAEAMDTGAACRTYNILIAEERKVAAALIKL